MNRRSTEQERSKSVDHAHQPWGPLSFGVACLTVVLWAGTAVGNRYAVDAVPPVAVGGIRFGLACIFMLFWCRIEGTPLLLQRRHWKSAMVLGVLLFAQISLFNIGLAHSNSSHASLFVNSFVFWVTAYEHWIARTLKLRWWQTLGLFTAAAGCVILLRDDAPTGSAQPRDPATLYGDLILAASGFCLAIKILYTKHAVRNVSPGPLILWHDVVGTALFCAYSYCFEPPISSWKLTWPSTWALLYVGLAISGFCFAANAWLLKRHSASQVSVFSFATPVLGVALGVMLRGDLMTIWLLIAGLCVAAGILLVNWSPAKPAEEPSPSA